VQILNNYIHDTSFVGIRSYSAKADHLHIQGNKTYHIGPSACRSPQIQLFAQNSLIENNDQSYGEDFNRVHGNHLVYRNNTLHDDYVSDAIGAPGCTGNGHLDGFQSFCAGTLNEAANYVLIEGNYYHDNPDNDEHFGLINGTDATNCTGVGAVVGSTTVIVRGNRIHGVGALSYVSDGNHNIAEQHKYYNNTTVSGAVGSPVHVTVDLTGTTQGSVLNNIFVDALQNAPPYQAYALKTGDSTSTGDYDLAFMSTGSVTWASPINAEPHHILNKNPLLTTTDSLQTGSPAIQAGGPLTTVATTDSGGGTLLVVADAHFFQDGWAGVSPDWIAVGSVTNVAQITSIDYSTNTISLTGAITRTAGQPVWLYKNSSGRRMLYDAAPDVGASPNPISPSPAPPTGPATIIF
jgi:hypothetical protein